MKILARTPDQSRSRGAGARALSPFRFSTVLATLWLVLQAATTALAANWYVDADRGANGDGRAWTSAWKELTNVVWTSVSPGDTVWISGGTYSGRVLVDRNGTAAAPITLKASREAGHNTPIILNGRISLGNAEYITFDGSKSDTHSITNAASTTNLMSNINWTIRQGDANTSAIIVFGNSKGLKFKWLEVDGGGSSNSGNTGIGFGGADHALNEIAYCHIHDIGQDGISGNNATRDITDFDIHHCYIHHTGDDGLELSGGARIRDSRIERTSGYNGHPDAIQCPDDTYEIYNNIIGDYSTGHIYNGFRHRYSSHFWVYNNFIYTRYTNATQAGIQIVIDQTLKETGNEVWDNVRIFNNTIYNCPGGISFFNRYAGTYTCTVSNTAVVNNLIHNNTGKGISMKGWPASGVVFDRSEVVVSNNVVSGSNPYAKLMDYLNPTVVYSTAEQFNSGTGFTGNRSATPNFVNLAKFDLRLADTDNVARDAGANLTSLGISSDLDGVLRPSSGPWNIGAFEVSNPSAPTAPTGLRLVSAAVEPPSSDGLLVHIDFEDDFADGRVKDAAGGDHDMIRVGFTANPTNWPTRVPGRLGSYAANFGHDKKALYPAGNTDDFHVGQYGAITNLTGLRTMTKATIAFWGYYNTSISNQMTFDHNATFLDAGYAKKGSWHFGRYYSTTYGNTRFLISTNDGAGIGASARLTWPEDYNATFGNSGGWKHYAVSVDCSSGNAVIKGYFNGVEFGSMTVPGVAALRVADVPGTGATGYEWIAVGCWTHNGTATLDDNDYLPNNGWLNGGLDDIRIYDRVLTPAEVNALTLSASSTSLSAAAP